MGWLKHIVVDVVVTALIVVAVIAGWAWARWVVLIYTGLMLLLKVGAVFGGRTVKTMQGGAGDVPKWVYHLLYLVDVGVLAARGWWIAAAGWLAIWLLSYIQEKR